MKQTRAAITMGPDIVVVGSINTDLVGRGLQLPSPGTTVRGGEFYSGPGGKGANQAIAAARLGARVALVAKVGADERGRELVRGLRDEGIDTSLIGSDPGTPSGVALVQVDEGGQKQIQVIPGANERLSADDVQRAADLMRGTKVVITQLEISMEALTAAIAIGQETGAFVILDPAPPTELSDQLLHRVSLIRPNANEAKALTGVPVHDRMSAREAARVLLQRGVGAVAVGIGAHGNLVAWPGGEAWNSGLRVATVDATGAGDSFVGALASRLSQGDSFADASRFANAAAALATTEFGAQTGLPTEAEVLRLLDAQGR